ncbi:ribbon-helix-helix protein, CopG family [Neorhizobium tomejilense]|uniref:ribbon-helix-helix protein, CopG family n=1 Tax=Neorhizobium tomejilense TaxID=2093828 RepID=UPI000CF86152|nr:ribbon-helix-helix protein, CopG family [Neorhizobium tomejilense]
MSDEKTANMVLRSVYLPQDLDANLRDLAFQSEKSKNELIRELVQEALPSYKYPDGGTAVPASSKGEKTANMVLRSVYVPQELDGNLRQLAFKSEMSKNELIRELVQEALKSRGYSAHGKPGKPNTRVVKPSKTTGADANADG